ncbi:3-deoxy-D-manno-octulosonic-acid transferase [Poseidonocella sedimentorum]|uniref:3-deoxy-D-manno-octulosonic acid transferase n=1 Tax=Poseidonocella sedimentorum TaxID=871652 RepID=A0A1I6EFJ7_9RHOB|nr:3-deoxy-D-manno-octulosonic-acid transferase [Poseidonocella sedimentorum]
MLLALSRLGWRLEGIDPSIRLLLTHPGDVTMPAARLHPASRAQPLPSGGGLAAMLAEEAPAVAVWSEGGERLRCLSEIHAQGIPILLAGLDAVDLPTERRPWLRAPAHAALRFAARALVPSTEARGRLIRLGMAGADVEVTGPLGEGGIALPVAEHALDEMTAEIGSRPVWLAAMVTRAEASAVMAAHRGALRSAHRLLLILVPAEPDTDDALAEQLRREGWKVAQHGRGEAIDGQTEVYVVDGPFEMGLWYRLAPVSFLGSSLVAGGGGCDPFEAAALGSAILYGPNVGPFVASYSRLASAGAARIVNDSGSLAQGLQRLLAPDQAAAQAHAAWVVASDGAAASDRLIAAITERLEEGGAI